MSRKRNVARRRGPCTLRRVMMRGPEEWRRGALRPSAIALLLASVAAQTPTPAPTPLGAIDTVTFAGSSVMWGGRKDAQVLGSHYATATGKMYVVGRGHQTKYEAACVGKYYCKPDSDHPTLASVDAVSGNVEWMVSWGTHQPDSLDGCSAADMSTNAVYVVTSVRGSAQLRSHKTTPSDSTSGRPCQCKPACVCATSKGMSKGNFMVAKIAVASPDVNGRVKWQMLAGGEERDVPHAAVLSPDKASLYVYGRTSSDLTCADAPCGTASSLQEDIFIAKLATADGELDWITRFGTDEYSDYPATILMLPHPAGGSTSMHSLFVAWTSRSSSTESTTHDPTYKFPCIGIDRQKMDGSDTPAPWDSNGFDDSSVAYRGPCGDTDSDNGYAAVVGSSDGKIHANGVSEQYAVRWGSTEGTYAQAAALQPLGGTSASDDNRRVAIVGASKNSQSEYAYKRNLGECGQGACGGFDALLLVLNLKWQSAKSTFSIEWDTVLRWGSSLDDRATAVAFVSRNQLVVSGWTLGYIGPCEAGYTCETPEDSTYTDVFTSVIDLNEESASPSSAPTQAPTTLSPTSAPTGSSEAGDTADETQQPTAAPTALPTVVFQTYSLGHTSHISGFEAHSHLQMHRIRQYGSIGADDYVTALVVDAQAVPQRVYTLGRTKGNVVACTFPYQCGDWDLFVTYFDVTSDSAPPTAVQWGSRGEEVAARSWNRYQHPDQWRTPDRWRTTIDHPVQNSALHVDKSRSAVLVVGKTDSVDMSIGKSCQAYWYDNPGRDQSDALTALDVCAECNAFMTSIHIDMQVVISTAPALPAAGTTLRGASSASRVLEIAEGASAGFAVTLLMPSESALPLTKAVAFVELSGKMNSYANIVGDATQLLDTYNSDSGGVRALFSVRAVDDQISVSDALLTGSLIVTIMVEGAESFASADESACASTLYTTAIVSMFIQDNDEAEFAGCTRGGGDCTEKTTTDIFVNGDGSQLAVRLQTQPSADVIATFSFDPPMAGLANVPTTLTFPATRPPADLFVSIKASDPTHSESVNPVRVTMTTSLTSADADYHGLTRTDVINVYTTVIASICGCNPDGCATDGDGSSTTTCSTSGNIPLTLSGVFPSPSTALNLRVQIGTADCYGLSRGDANVPSTSAITCTLPEGVGMLLVPTTYVNGIGYYPAVGSARVSYGAPTIASASGCARAQGAATFDCVRAGGTHLVLTGINYGNDRARGAIVLVNGQLCGRIGGAADSHTTLHCALPSGVIRNAPVQVLQSGAISDAQTYVNYVQCSKGQRQVGLECVDCPSGQFSASENAVDCTSCEAGMFAAAPQSTECVDCSQGRFQGTLASSDCNECLGGQFSSKPAQSSCDVCEAGTFSETGAVTCSPCPHGKHAAAKGGGEASEAAVACLPCVGRKYTPGARSTTCLSCAEGTYLPYARASSCFTCPGERVACADGVASLHAKSWVTSCRPGGSNASLPRAATNSTGCVTPERCPASASPIDSESTVYECPLLDACKTVASTCTSEGCGGSFPRVECNEGFTGPLCASCCSEYALIGSKCTLCPVEKWYNAMLAGLLVVGTVAVVSVLVLTRLKSACKRMDGGERSVASGVLRVFLNWVQTLTLLRSNGAKPPSSLTDMLKQVSPFTDGFSADAFPLQCLFQWDQTQKTIVSMAVPVVALVAPIFAIIGTWAALRCIVGCAATQKNRPGFKSDADPDVAREVALAEEAHDRELGRLAREKLENTHLLLDALRTVRTFLAAALF